MINLKIGSDVISLPIFVCNIQKDHFKQIKAQ